MSTKDLCRESLAFFIDDGLLGRFEETGPQRPAFEHLRPLLTQVQRTLVHYASCRGLLYQDDDHWRFAYELVRSFTRRGRREVGSAFTLPGLFGTISGVRAVDLLDQLPFVFEPCGFRSLGLSKVSRSVVFVSEQRSRVSGLPEPYGKWCQHRLGRPQWDQEVDLEVEVSCRLGSPSPNDTTIDLGLSTLAFPIVQDLAERLGGLLGRGPLAVPSPRTLLDRAAAGGCRLTRPGS